MIYLALYLVIGYALIATGVCMVRFVNSDGEENDILSTMMTLTFWPVLLILGLVMYFRDDE